MNNSDDLTINISQNETKDSLIPKPIRNSYLTTFLCAICLLITIFMFFIMPGLICYNVYINDHSCDKYIDTKLTVNGTYIPPDKVCCDSSNPYECYEGDVIFQYNNITCNKINVEID